MPVLFVLFLVVFAMNFVLGLAGSSDPVLTLGLGATALAIGLLLVLNLRGVAAHHSAYLKQHRLRGVDYSESYFANPLFARLLGAGMTVVGTVFVVVSIAA
jgi:hypothetical protein